MHYDCVALGKIIKDNTGTRYTHFFRSISVIITVIDKSMNHGWMLIRWNIVAVVCTGRHNHCDSSTCPDETCTSPAHPDLDTCTCTGPCRRHVYYCYNPSPGSCTDMHKRHDIPLGPSLRSCSSDPSILSLTAARREGPPSWWLLSVSISAHLMVRSIRHIGGHEYTGEMQPYLGRGSYVCIPLNRSSSTPAHRMPEIHGHVWMCCAAFDCLQKRHRVYCIRTCRHPGHGRRIPVTSNSLRRSSFPPARE